jgi:hypothetical protein
MSNTNFETVSAALAAIPENEVLTPAIPVSVFVQEAENLKVCAEEDKEKLTVHGLDWTLVESLTDRAGACRQAQSVWAWEYKSREDAEKEWIEKSPEAFKMRDSLMTAFRYAFRSDESLLAKVSTIAQGSTREDMIQDLNDLSVLGKANAALLEVIKFDSTQLDLAAETSSKMAPLLAAAKGEKGNYSESLDRRNRAYTYLKMAVDEIRSCGKYVFALSEPKLRGYRSEYLRTRRRKTKNEKPDTTQAAA